jgi:hypothetical protein
VAVVQEASTDLRETRQQHRHHKATMAETAKSPEQLRIGQILAVVVVVLERRVNLVSLALEAATEVRALIATSQAARSLTQAAEVADTASKAQCLRHTKVELAVQAEVVRALAQRHLLREAQIPEVVAAERAMTAQRGLERQAAPASSSFAISAPSVQQAARSRAQAATRSTRSRRAAHLT